MTEYKEDKAGTRAHAAGVGVALMGGVFLMVNATHWSDSLVAAFMLFVAGVLAAHD